MRRNRLCLISVFLFFSVISGTEAQKSKPQKPAKKTTAARTETAGQASNPQNIEKVRDLVAFFELLLNTLGSNSASARDKEVVITESYAKIFRDGNVQVEDDLAENRSTITNKDVVAYLRDVDFFFDNATFEFTIDDIEEGVNVNGQVFYKVSLRRNLAGTTVGGKEINNTIPRYIEVNYEPQKEDLKIVSVYTNEFDEKEALTNWWTSLSFEWQTVFKRKFNITDSVVLNQIKDMMSVNELDLSGNQFIQSLEPLAQLVNLKMLNLAGTAISDLTPIRNLTELVELDISGTQVFDLQPLRYASKLARLNISRTEIRSVAVLERMPEMQNLEMRFSHVIDFAPLGNLTRLVNLDLEATQLGDLAPIAPLVSLMELNISRAPIQDLGPISKLIQLVTLDLDSTLIRDLRPLSGMENLEVLYANYTFISDLAPLKDLPKLDRIYCDQTPIKKAAADSFMAANPDVLVIYDSKDLQAWWSTLSPEWQQILITTAAVRAFPGKEELARVTNLDSINLANIRSIKTLEPLRRLQKLKVIVANNTGIDDLAPLEDHRELRFLDISDTEVVDLSPASKFERLEEFRADRSKIEKLDPLFALKQLKKVYVDRTTIHDITAREFFDHNPECLLVYKTLHLDRWWSNLPEGWRTIFRQKLGEDTTTSRENLHLLVEMEVFGFSEAPVRDLSPLAEFVRLKKLHFSSTAIAAIPDLESLYGLESLHATNSPLQRIGAIGLLKELVDLDISNTPVDDLRGLEGMENLRSFNCAGTQVKKLDPLASLYQLEILDCSNTLIRTLDPVMYLSLKSLKCYNTRINSRRVDEFRENNPECQVVYYR